MKIVIAPDSFKECLRATEVAHAIARGWQCVDNQAICELVPMADGGEGTTEALVAACNGQWREISVQDPLGRTIQAHYGWLPDEIAVIEMAQAAGLALLTPSERNPLITSTFGVGQMLADALQNGARKIILGIGGSATNDGGAGLAQALGIRLLDAQGRDLPHGGAALSQLAHIDDAGSLHHLHECEIIVACDVVNPLCGETGAAAVFAPQKGATPAMVAELDAALTHFADQVAQHTGEDFRNHAGSGAAGGLGFGLRSLLGAQLQSGIDIVLHATQLSDKIAHADLVITGEGRMDAQTAFGKVPLGVLRVAQTHNIPVIGIAGSVSHVHELNDLGFAAVLPTIARAGSLHEIIAEAETNIENTATQIARLWQIIKAQHT